MIISGRAASTFHLSTSSPGGQSLLNASDCSSGCVVQPLWWIHRPFEPFERLFVFILLNEMSSRMARLTLDARLDKITPHYRQVTFWTFYCRVREFFQQYQQLYVGWGRILPPQAKYFFLRGWQTRKIGIWPPNFAFTSLNINSSASLSEYYFRTKTRRLLRLNFHICRVIQNYHRPV